MKEFSIVWGPSHTGGPGQTAPVALPPPSAALAKVSKFIVFQAKLFLLLRRAGGSFLINSVRKSPGNRRLECKSAATAAVVACGTNYGEERYSWPRPQRARKTEERLVHTVCACV